MSYDIKKVKRYLKSWGPETLNSQPITERETALYNLVNNLFVEMNKCCNGEVFVRSWPVLERTFEGGYEIGTRIAAEGWLDPQHKKGAETKIYGFGETPPYQRWSGGPEMVQYGGGRMSSIHLDGMEKASIKMIEENTIELGEMLQIAVARSKDPDGRSSGFMIPWELLPSITENLKIELERKTLKTIKNKDDLGMTSPTDWQALRCIMAAIIYGEIRHEKFLQHDLSNLEPRDLYRSVFQAVDGLIGESKNG